MVEPERKAESPIRALQEAIYDRLKLVLTQAPLVPVYDEVPDDKAYPYIEIGEHRYAGSNTKLDKGWEGGVTIHIWSSYRGVKEVADILDRVLAALTETDLELEDGWDVIDRGFDEVSVLDEQYLDSTQKLKHAIVRQRFKLLRP